MRFLLSSVLLIASFGACTPYDPKLSAQPFLCGQSDPKCPDGYACTGMDGMNRPLCVATDGSGTTVDGGLTGFQCAEQTADIEGPNRNDTIATAWQTPVGPTKPTFPLAGVSICPDGDKDTYEVNITGANQDLTATVEYQADGAALSVIILNSGGTAISSSSPAGTDKVTTKLLNAASGSSPYYIQVYGPATGKNNYKITFAVTNP